jgi:hypothetical protein
MNTNVTAIFPLDRKLPNRFEEEGMNKIATKAAMFSGTL